MRDGNWENEKMMAVAMACLCMVGAIVFSSEAANAKTAAPITQSKLSKTELNLYPNMTAQIKVINAGEEVKWSSTNSKIVSILGSSEKNQKTVAIRTKNKTGACKIKATTAGKTFTCKVTVKKDSKVSRVKLLDVKKNAKKVKVKVKIDNRSGKVNWFGYSYTVEKFVNGAWKKLGPDLDFTSEAIRIPAYSTMEQEYTVSNSIGRKQFTKGLYRLNINVVGMKYNYALFSL